MAPITLESHAQPLVRQLKVITKVINDNGGNMTAKDFTTTVTAPYPVSPRLFQGNESGTMVELIHSIIPTFRVNQGLYHTYVTTYDGDCVNQQNRIPFRFLPQYVCTIINNDIPLNFDMLSFGDSVMWGTGLLHQQKFRTLVEGLIKERYPNVPATANAYSHTGAEIGSSFYNIFRWDEVPGQDTQKLKDFLKRQFYLDWTNANVSKDGETAINIGPGCTLGVHSRCNSAKISLNPGGDSANISWDPQGLGLFNRNSMFASKFVDGERTMSLSPDYYKRFHGEIPHGFPTILQMVDEYRGPIEPDKVDLILLQGCINDVGATTTLLDDQISHNTVVSIIDQYCYRDMKTLLQAVSYKFPNAIIIVNGYFIAVSQQTIDNGGKNIINAIVTDLFPNYDIIVSHWDLWNRDHKSDIRQAIQEVDPSGNRIFFADSLFGPENAVLGENALLFGNAPFFPPDCPPLLRPLFPDGCAFIPLVTDPALGERAQACERELPPDISIQPPDTSIQNFKRKLTCFMASTAHPTPEGAMKYAGEIMRILDNGVLSNIMTHLDQPKPISKLSLAVEPNTIIARLPTSVVVYAKDDINQTPINGSVLIDSVVVGTTNVPFNYTFNRSSVGAKVVAPNYLNASIGFNINNKLDVTAIPNIVDLSSVSPTNITISAISPGTNQPIEGKVLTNEGRTLLNKIDKEIGSTNVPFPHLFRPHIEGSVLSGSVELYAPEVIVVAPTYDDTQVQIQFINIPPGTDVEPPDDGPPDDDGPCELGSPTEMRPECR